MPLIQCSECSKQMSDKADSCPHCGKPHHPTVICPECDESHNSPTSCPNCGFCATTTCKSEKKQSTSPTTILTIVAIIIGLSLVYNIVQDSRMKAAQEEDCQYNRQLIEDAASSYINIMGETSESMTVENLRPYYTPPKCPNGGEYTIRVLPNEVMVHCSHH